MKYNEVYVVREQYTKEVILTNVTAEDVNKFIAKSALSMNYGIYRSWQIDGVTYYDCGPVTYTVEKVLELTEKSCC